jgi:U4/U6.U5 tri-snRNP-associated protein 1
MSEEVLELSVQETNKLRYELGLGPLRISDAPATNHGNVVGDTTTSSSEAAPNNVSSEKEVLEMSVEETNDLRAKLGLKPLTTGKSKEEVHKPATNDRAAQEAAERIERAKLQRDVENGIAKTFGSSTLADENDNSALSWAERMRQQKTDTTKKKKAKKSKDGESNKTTETTTYDEKDLEGVHVAHNMSELEAGSTTVLTLADVSLLETSQSKKAIGLNEEGIALENVNLAEQKKQQDGLRKKRLLEMGMGRAGGYAGFDDEEFEELGGTQGPARTARGNGLLEEDEDEEGPSKPRGFRLGVEDPNGDASMTDLDKIQQGKAISLLPTRADVAGNDYMTIEEEEEERAKKKKKKDSKFKKKRNKKDKKRRRANVVESDNEEMEQAGSGAPKDNKPNLLEQLEETAQPETSGLRKRRRSNSDDEEETGTKKDGFVKVENGQTSANAKRSKYDEIMAKGNERTRLAFQGKQLKPKIEETFDEEEDDSFLNAALAKARRLNRLRGMSSQPKYCGADAVAEAVKSSKTEEPDATTSGTLSFSIDDTREFTRAIRAKAQQKEREVQKSKQLSTKGSSNVVVVKQEEAPAAEIETKEPAVEDVDTQEEMDIEELAKEVKTDDIPLAGFEGAAAESVGVGRGLASFVSMLKHTGEISKKHAGKEELRGRAKDVRNYENYHAMDLKKVVKIGRNATDKDKEMANREIKLEYRDKHGRLLTQKEAFRDLCYQFHGHGASKKTEEKRLKQIALEQAEARLASRQVSAARDGTTAGTLGALKVTQKATGKAFIVHKT